MSRRRRVILWILAASATGGLNTLAAQAVTVILVRHAEKAPGRGDDPPLTQQGMSRADSLAAAVRDADVGSIVITQFRRTAMTAAPLAAARHLTPTMLRVGTDVTGHARALAALLAGQRPGNVVVVIEHSNTIPAILKTLGGPDVPELCPAEYGTMFVVTLRPGRKTIVVRTRYGSPDAPAATACHGKMGT